MNQERFEAQNRMVAHMVAKIDEQLGRTPSGAMMPHKGHQYILEGFTDEELRMFRMFVKSFGIAPDSTLTQLATEPLEGF